MNRQGKNNLLPIIWYEGIKIVFTLLMLSFGTSLSVLIYQFYIKPVLRYICFIIISNSNTADFIFQDELNNEAALRDC